MKKLLFFATILVFTSLQQLTAQTFEPTITKLSVDSNLLASATGDSVTYLIKIAFNTLNSLKQLYITVGSSRDADDVWKRTAEYHIESHVSLLRSGSEDITFFRYSVSIPMKLHKNDKNKWQYISAQVENEMGKTTEKSYLKR